MNVGIAAVQSAKTSRTPRSLPAGPLAADSPRAGRAECRRAQVRGGAEARRRLLLRRYLESGSWPILDSRDRPAIPQPVLERPGWRVPSESDLRTHPGKMMPVTAASRTVRSYRDSDGQRRTVHAKMRLAANTVHPFEGMPTPAQRCLPGTSTVGAIRGGYRPAVSRRCGPGGEWP
jgi:hypothetical protein